MSYVVSLGYSFVSLPFSKNRIDPDWMRDGPDFSESSEVVFATFCSFRIRCS